jgi:hypothetical protein
MVESQIVVLAVAGSSPVGHPNLVQRLPTCDWTHKLAGSATLWFQNASSHVILPAGDSDELSSARFAKP